METYAVFYNCSFARFPESKQWNIAIAVNSDVCIGTKEQCQSWADELQGVCNIRNRTFRVFEVLEIDITEQEYVKRYGDTALGKQVFWHARLANPSKGLVIHVPDIDFGKVAEVCQGNADLKADALEAAGEA